MPRSEEGASRAGTRRSGSRAQNPKAAGAAFALLRIFAGLMFLVSGIEKRGWPGSDQLRVSCARIAAAEQGTWLGPFARLLTHTVAPHAALFTWLIVAGEIVIGLLLTFGLLSRAASLAAMALNLCYLFGYWYLGAPWQMLNEAFLMLEVAFLMVGPGRTFGLDSRLARRHPGWGLW